MDQWMEELLDKYEIEIYTDDLAKDEHTLFVVLTTEYGSRFIEITVDGLTKIEAEQLSEEYAEEFKVYPEDVWWF
jgi:enolase